VVLHGPPETVLPRVAKDVGAYGVHIAADFGPYGRRRDAAVEAALGAVPLVRTGSPYAVAPGRLTKADGTAFRVFSPFSRAWLAHGWRAPAAAPGSVRWAGGATSSGIPADPPLPAGLRLPEMGERAARQRWQTFVQRGLSAYAEDRNIPAGHTTSQVSVDLKYGALHPRTMLADLTHHGGAGADSYRNELCWRDFYADVLWHNPESAREYLQPQMAGMQHDTGATADARFVAWMQGRTGYPAVDAAMRQLEREGWMHNRMRMVVASFLVKDLHLEWTRGARYFMSMLRDGDLASNNHGWQWVAGSGTDPAPYFRIFNPVTQGRKFDPDGQYVRTYVAELAEVPGGAVHEPWTLSAGLPAGYPERIVIHDAERKEALRRYAAVRR